MREKLAELMHEIWADRMRFMFSCCVERYVIPIQAGRRWERQMGTPYDELSEDEKDSDRKVADKVLELFASRLLPNLENKEETVALIPSSVMRLIYDTLLEAFAVEVPYSEDGLEMAQLAIAKQKAGIKCALDLMNEHCGLGRSNEPRTSTGKGGVA